MGAKRAVPGRSRDYDILLFEWQKATNPGFLARVEEKEREQAAAAEAAAIEAERKKNEPEPAPKGTKRNRWVRDWMRLFEIHEVAKHGRHNSIEIRSLTDLRVKVCDLRVEFVASKMSSQFREELIILTRSYTFYLDISGLERKGNVRSWIEREADRRSGR